MSGSRWAEETGATKASVLLPIRYVFGILFGYGLVSAGPPKEWHRKPLFSSPFLAEEQSELPEIIEKASAALKQILQEGVEKAQNVRSFEAGGRSLRAVDQRMAI